LKEAWCSDDFSAMVGEGKKTQKFLLELVTAFLEKWQHDEGLLPEGPLAELHEDILKVVLAIVVGEVHRGSDEPNTWDLG
jgi:hypothetical protein